jgi:signal peptidase I
VAAPRTRSEESPQAPPPPGFLRQVWDQVGTLLLAVGIALAVRSCVIEPFRIPSGSMLPTLLIGDHLFVNKFIYGIEIPFTNVRLPGIREPQRGDVVVFEVARQPGPGGVPMAIFPADRRPDLPTESFVKRLIGLPGDTIQVRGGQLVVNGVPVPQEPSGGTFTAGHPERAFVVKREQLLGHDHATLDDPAAIGKDGTWTVEPGRYLMVGDNRDDSNDGRYWGTIRFEEMKGPAFVLYWSWDFEGGWLELVNPLTWINLLWNETRWDRIGDPVI